VVEQRVRSIVGAGGVVDVDATGCVQVAPESEEECALLLAVAHRERWSVRFCGCGNWIPLDAPADLAMSTKRLRAISDLSAADMAMTAQAGSPLGDLQAAAAKQGTWIALDPPGGTRTLGSILSTGTAGPLQTGFGTVRNRILGLTFVTADGRLIRVGGRVVKNVAGFDLTSLLIGSFGAFGLITSAHIRLNAVPAADITSVARADRDTLLDCARIILSAGVTPAAMELVAPDTHERDGWALSVRVTGSEAAVAADHKDVVDAVPQFAFEELDDASASRFWQSTLNAATDKSTTIRLGSLQSDIGPALDSLKAELDGETGAVVSTSVLGGVIRWSCNTSAERIRNLRTRATDRGWPVTLERAPWEVRNNVGHYGAYRDGVERIVGSLRGVFDDRGILTVPLGPAE